TAKRLHRPSACRLAGGRRSVALPPLPAHRLLVRAVARRARDPGPVRDAGHRPRNDLRLGAVRRPRGDSDAARARERAGAGGGDARRNTLAAVLAHHAAVDPLGSDLRRDPDDRALPRRVRSRGGRLRPDPRQDRDRDDGHRRHDPELPDERRLRRRCRPRHHRGGRAHPHDPDQTPGGHRLMSIEIRNVTKRFGSFLALDDVSLEISQGSLTALLGPSGSGKSTLLRIVAGLERPDSGEIMLSGEEATRLAPQRRDVGFVFQHYAAFKHMTVRDNVGFALSIRKRPKQEIRERVDELLELVQLSGFADRYPSKLSGGQRQRMALARALAAKPRVLLLDHPSVPLDARVRAEFGDWRRRLPADVHVTTVFVTHDQEEAMEVADRVAVLDHGRLEQVGAPAELYDNPASDFVLRFVGDAVRLGERLVRPHEILLRRWPSDGAVEVEIQRIAVLGADARVDLADGGGERLTARLRRDELDDLDLERGEIVWASAEPFRGLASAGDP